ATAAPRARDPRGHRPGRVVRVLGHGLRLPRFHIVAALLGVADRLAEVDADTAGLGVDAADGEQGDLVLEIDEGLHDDARARHAGARLRVLPGPVHVVRAVQGGLALARRRHRRLHKTRVPDRLARLTQFLTRGRERVAAGR